MPKVARSAGPPGPSEPALADGETLDPRPPSLARRAAGRAFAPGILFGLGLIILCALAAPWVARRLPELGERPDYALTPDRVRLDPPPPHPVPADLAARVLGGEPISILEDGLAERLAKGFRKHPWVRRVTSVAVSHPAAARVELAYRTPAAAVAVRDGLYPVDAGGVVLPPADFTRPAADALPRIAGDVPVPGPAGAVWPGGEVAGAAAVCAALAKVWDDCDLAAVRPLPPGSEKTHDDFGGVFGDAGDDDAGDDVETPPDAAGVRYELVTRGGSHILWGRAPGSGHPGELTAAQKRDRLTGRVRTLLADERTAGPRRVDLTAWDGIYHEPLRPPAAAHRTAGRLTPPAARR